MSSQTLEGLVVFDVQCSSFFQNPDCLHGCQNVLELNKAMVFQLWQVLATFFTNLSAKAFDNH